jgi:hypothetical protein
LIFCKPKKVDNIFSFFFPSSETSIQVEWNEWHKAKFEAPQMCNLYCTPAIKYNKRPKMKRDTQQ